MDIVRGPPRQGDDDFPSPTQMWGGLELFQPMTLGVFDRWLQTFIYDFYPHLDSKI